MQSFLSGIMVVHEKHGLGIYPRYQKRLRLDKIVKDTSKSSTRDGAISIFWLHSWMPCRNIPVQIRQNHLKLNKLGTQEWNRTKSKVKGAVKNIAKRAGGAVRSTSGKRRLCLWAGYCVAAGI